MRITVQLGNMGALQSKVKYLIQGAQTGLKFGVSEGAQLVETAAKEKAPDKSATRVKATHRKAHAAD